MSPARTKLNLALIRLAKGMITAWEEWVRSEMPANKVIENPDPVEHFRKQIAAADKGIAT